MIFEWVAMKAAELEDEGLATMQGRIGMFGFEPARVAGAVVALACSVVVALTGAAGLHGSNAAGAPENAPVAMAFSDDDGAPCEDYVLSRDEIAAAQKEWPGQREEMIAGAAAWSANAVLVQLTLNCDFFNSEGDAEETTDGIKWNGVFYDASGAEHLYWHSATGESYFVFEETALDPAQISFEQLAEWLDKADFDDNHRIVSVIVTYNPASKPEPDDHFSYVVTYVDKDMKLFELMIDGRDGTAVEKAVL